MIQLECASMLLGLRFVSGGILGKGSAVISDCSRGRAMVLERLIVNSAVIHLLIHSPDVFCIFLPASSSWYLEMVL